jgi:hypothetical protein
MTEAPKIISSPKDLENKRYEITRHGRTEVGIPAGWSQDKEFYLFRPTRRGGYIFVRPEDFAACVREKKPAYVPKTHAQRPNEDRTYCYYKIGDEVEDRERKLGEFYAAEGEEPTCKVCLKAMKARERKSK